MAESVTPRPTPARERLYLLSDEYDHRTPDFYYGWHVAINALLDNLPLVMEAAEEAGKAERIVHPEMTANLIGRTPVWWIR